MKNTLLLVTFVLINVFAKAQSNNNIAVSLGINANIPSENSIGGPGFSAAAELPVLPGLKFALSAGYTVNYWGTRYYTTNPYICPTCVIPSVPQGPANGGWYAFIPLTAGIRYYYYRHFYFSGQAGEALKVMETENSFIYGGAFGGLFRFRKHSALDLSVGIEDGYRYADYNYSTIYEIGLRVAYRYQF